MLVHLAKHRVSAIKHEEDAIHDLAEMANVDMSQIREETSPFIFVG